jgi:hypothetical protein
MASTPKDTASARLARRLMEDLRVIAEANQRSVSAELRIAVERYNRAELAEARRVIAEREDR